MSIKKVMYICWAHDVAGGNENQKCLGMACATR